MPLYHYRCEACPGDFAMMHRMSECRLPENCPECGGVAPRILQATYLNTMAGNNRIAHQRNERSADEPRVERRMAVRRRHAGATTVTRRVPGCLGTDAPDGVEETAQLPSATPDAAVRR